MYEIYFIDSEGIFMDNAYYVSMESALDENTIREEIEKYFRENSDIYPKHSRIIIEKVECANFESTEVIKI